MSITPIDIQQHRFKTRPFGYEKAGVDHFLELISEEIERLTRVSQGLKEELARARVTMEEMRGREATLKQTLMTAQQMSDDMKNNARREGEILIADAQLRAERIVRDAEDRRIQLVSEIQEIKRQKIAFETGLRTLVESHLRLLDLDVVSVAGRGFGELEGSESSLATEERSPSGDERLELEGF
ncbi:DivIVA domain-containing protein [Trichloromonas sp.]|uniref:DivIVA domain-containing protein n=1 Tax=Trichloromonas sp. TaxID=3069249 RepID=UPI002A4A5C89|nr:DivIVA domain-containing protein [Trichloromonas sp.]